MKWHFLAATLVLPHMGVVKAPVFNRMEPPPNKRWFRTVPQSPKCRSIPASGSNQEMTLSPLEVRPRHRHLGDEPDHLEVLERLVA